MFWSQSVSEKSFLIKLSPAPESDMHYAGCILCDDRLTGIDTFQFHFLKRNVMLAFSNIQISEFDSGKFFSIPLFVLFLSFSYF